MTSAEVITLGCRLNIAESETLLANFGAAKLGGDLVVINSCAVTAEAMAASRRAVRKAARARPSARIVVTGCASDVDREAFENMAEVAAVVPNAAKLDPSAYPSSQRRPGSPEAGAPSMEIPASAGMTPSSHARAFLAVQTGCDHRCTFCIIPYGRGPSRSVPAGELVGLAQAAIDAGKREIVLTGVDLTAYGADLPGTPTLAMLVERLLRFVPGIERLRISSLDGPEIDDRLFALLAHERRVMPHVHLSLQAGDDLILKRMKRRHSRAQSLALVERLKAARPEIAIGADLIAGFPTESEAMFEGTLALLDDCDIVTPHIFPFSPRAGTPAALMPQLEREVIRARAAKLREAGAARTMRWLQGHVDTVQNMLVERDGASGHAEDFAKVRIAARSEWAGTVRPVRIAAVEDDHLVGIPA